jgi:hypothetical protein
MQPCQAAGDTYGDISAHLEFDVTQALPQKMEHSSGTIIKPKEPRPEPYLRITPLSSTPLSSTAQHSTAQHSTAQHSTPQHSTAQHSTAQHRQHQRQLHAIHSLMQRQTE